MKYYITFEYVPELNSNLWHVRERHFVHSIVAGAFYEKDLAESYCDYLNN